MRFRQLRRVLQQIVLVGLPASQAGCGLFTDCYETRSKLLEVSTPADAQMQFRIDRCEIDAADCSALCELAMERAGLPPYPSACEVAFEPDRVLLDVEYEVSSGGSGCPVDGRRPAGLERIERVRSTGIAGAWLAHAAWLEAASVHAFVHLARELQSHGAPNGLVRGALAAARDEIRHTELMTRLALRYGGRPPSPGVALPGPRPLAELAIENAVEGCVRETWGAVMALRQSHTALDPVARATFEVIARDEPRHAALAWAIDRWLQPRLDAATSRRVADARAAAVDELLASTQSPSVPALGLPDGIETHALVARVNQTLWTGGQS